MTAFSRRIVQKVRATHREGLPPETYAKARLALRDGAAAPQAQLRRILVHMAQQVTITVSDEVYQGLQAVAGDRTVSEYLEELTRPPLPQPSLEVAYREMSLDAEREREATEWTEALAHDSLAGDAAR
jgi:predicted CopG family antitoxin